MNYKFFMLLAIVILAFIGCNSNSTTENKAKNEAANPPKTRVAISKDPFVEKVEKAHNRYGFLSKTAIQFDILLMFGGKERMNGKMTLLTNSSKGLIELQNGDKMYYVNDKVYYSPDIENEKRVRFNAYTWSYFFLFPFKLSDEGTVWSDYEPKTMNDKSYLVHKLTFKAGTGDAPDDWYVVYADEEKHLIDVAAYIVTANKTQAEAEEDPHAIIYKNYKEVSGVPIATNWEFWGWTTKDGLTEQLGEATLSNLKFVEVEDNLFEAPEGFKEI
ncbi:MAG: DUF6503 family protein [Chitinophagales bacterium]